MGYQYLRMPMPDPFTFSSSSQTIGVALLGQSDAGLLVGMMLVVLFAVNLGWLPAGQSGTPAHLVLPALTMSVYPMAQIARLTRASMSEALAEPYIDAAKARGITGRRWCGARVRTP